jgi:hypothetical protein
MLPTVSTAVAVMNVLHVGPIITWLVTIKAVFYNHTGAIFRTAYTVGQAINALHAWMAITFRPYSLKVILLDLLVPNTPSQLDMATLILTMSSIARSWGQ